MRPLSRSLHIVETGQFIGARARAHDAYVLPRLSEEVEINEIVTEGGAFVSRKRKVKVVIDVTKGESHDLKGVLY